MQKLVFRNANGIEIDLTSDPFGITEWEGFSADELNIQSQQVPFNDGSVFLDALLGERTLSVTVAMNDGNDLEKRYRLRREMISKLNPKLGEGVLIYTNDFISKQIHCIPQLPVFENHNSNDSGTPKANCSFQACNPYWEDLEDTVVSILSNIMTISEVVNNGDIPTGMQVEVSGKNVKRIVVGKDGEKIELNSYYAFPKDMTIDTNTGKKAVTGKGLFSNEGRAYTLSDTNYSILGTIIFDGEYYFSYSAYYNETEEKSYNAFFISRDLITWTKQGNDIDYLGIDELNKPKMLYNDFDNSIYLLGRPDSGETKLLKTTDRGATWQTTTLQGNYWGLCLNRKTQEIVYTQWDCVYNPTTQEVVELYYDENTGDAGIKINRSSGAIIKTYENFGVEVEYIELDSKNNYIVYHGTGQSSFYVYYIDANGNMLNSKKDVFGYTGFLEREDGYYFVEDVPFIGSRSNVYYTPTMESISSDFEIPIQGFENRVVFSKIDGIGLAVDIGNQQIFTVKESQNYISNLTSDSNMNLNLGVGTNKILTVTDTQADITISYRQKYIGV